MAQKVLVTGATGFVGYHTVMALAKAGFAVRLAVRSEAKLRQVYQDVGIDVSDFVVTDIADPIGVAKAVAGVDIVVHTAAMVSLDVNQQTAMHKTNVVGTRVVMDSAIKAGVKKILYVSSYSVLFNKTRNVIDESAPLVAVKNSYARTKRQSEDYVRSLIKQGENIIITYPSLIMGPDDPGLSAGNNAIKIYLNLCVLKTTSGIQLVDVRDLATAHVELLKKNAQGLFMVGGPFLSWADFARKLNAITAKPVRSIPCPAILLRMMGICVDSLKKLINLQSPLSVEATDYVTAWVVSDDSKLRETIAIKYRPVEETLAEAVQCLADKEYVSKAWLKK